MTAALQAGVTVILFGWMCYPIVRFVIVGS